MSAANEFRLLQSASALSLNIAKHLNWVKTWLSFVEWLLGASRTCLCCQPPKSYRVCPASIAENAVQSGTRGCPLLSDPNMILTSTPRCAEPETFRRCLCRDSLVHSAVWRNAHMLRDGKDERLILFSLIPEVGSHALTLARVGGCDCPGSSLPETSR